MSDSAKKYYELLEEGRIVNNTQNQTSTMTIVEILRASDCAGNIKTLLERVTEITKKGLNLTPATAFQIAGDEVKVDEVCTPEKQKQWNNQE
jgi:hypothetical protein